jgi:two-component system chemotaxis response regulator CheB
MKPSTHASLRADSRSRRQSSRDKRRTPRRPKGHDIIVVGTSAGGLEALDALIGQLSSDLSASIFIVHDMAPDNSGEPLLRRLSRHKAFEARLAKEGERFKPGRIYIAPPDSHLLLKGHTVLVRKGARENRSRPAVDPLFRSAAVAHGPRVIGVVLTGMLDDGTAGLIAIKRCGGVTVVQDPKDAAYSGMPQNALDSLDVDFCLPIAQMGQLLATLVSTPHGRTKPVPKDIRTEAAIAERVSSDVAQVDGLGSQVPYNCPNCGGVLWEMDAPKAKRYRCHTGHSFTEPALLASQSEKIEEMLWISLRMFEERKNLLNSTAKTAGRRGERRATLQQLGQIQGFIERIRGMLLEPRLEGFENELTRVKGLMAEPRKAKSARGGSRPS